MTRGTDEIEAVVDAARTAPEAEPEPTERYDRKPPFALMLGDHVNVTHPEGRVVSGTVTGLVQTAPGHVLVFVNGAPPDEGVPVPRGELVTLIRPHSNEDDRPVRWDADRAATVAAIERHIYVLQTALDRFNELFEDVITPSIDKAYEAGLDLLIKLDDEGEGGDAAGDDDED